MKKITSILLLISFFPVLAGCDALSGTLVGGGVGAGTGAIVGSASGHAGAGTAIGAGIGALTGLLVGSAFEQQQKTTVVVPATVVAAPAAQGQVIVACPKCAQHVDVSGFAPGSKVRCPVCNTIFTF